MTDKTYISQDSNIVNAEHVISTLLSNDRIVNFYPTGIDGLDELLGGGLTDRMYVLGGIAATGKTTLALQIAVETARNGNPVLFVSLEQSPNDLLSKILSRETKISGNKLSFSCTATDIKYNKLDLSELTELRDYVLENCSDVIKNINFYESSERISVEDLRIAILKLQELTDKTPLLVVDYLQLIASMYQKHDDKANVDEAVQQLKNIAKNLHVPVVVISSLNRNSYAKKINMSSFKESGLIEYSADVLMGLEPYKSQECSNSENEIQMTLTILKDKDAPWGTSVKLKFNPEYNTFTELF